MNKSSRMTPERSGVSHSSISQYFGSSMKKGSFICKSFFCSMWFLLEQLSGVGFSEELLSGLGVSPELSESTLIISTFLLMATLFLVSSLLGNTLVVVKSSFSHIKLLIETTLLDIDLLLSLLDDFFACNSG